MVPGGELQAFQVGKVAVEGSAERVARWRMPWSGRWYYMDYRRRERTRRDESENRQTDNSEVSRGEAGAVADDGLLGFSRRCRPSEIGCQQEISKTKFPLARTLPDNPMRPESDS